MSSVLLYGLKTKCLSTTNSKHQHPKKKGVGRVREKGKKMLKNRLSASRKACASKSQSICFFTVANNAPCRGGFRLLFSKRQRAFVIGGRNKANTLTLYETIPPFQSSHGFMKPFPPPRPIKPRLSRGSFHRAGGLVGLCALGAVTAGCLVSAPNIPPPRGKVENSVLLDASAKEVWGSVSRSAAENSLSLGRVHTDAGLITFDIILWPAQDYVNCGLIKAKKWKGKKQRITYENWVEKTARSLKARVTLSVISEGEKARLTIGARYTLRTNPGGGAIWIHWTETGEYSSHVFAYEVTCTPTHKLEEAFIDTVRGNLQKQQSAKKP